MVYQQQKSSQIYAHRTNIWFDHDLTLAFVSNTNSGCRSQLTTGPTSSIEYVEGKEKLTGGPNMVEIAPGTF